MEEIILKHALSNAVKFNGSASVNAVLGKLFSEKPDLRGNKHAVDLVIKTVNDVNAMSLDDQRLKLAEFSVLPAKKERSREIPDLSVKAKVVMRFAPNPNGALHLGHCRQALWNWFFAKKYNGTYILRFDDTDPKVKVPMKEAYKWIKDDMRWLGIKPKKTAIQSKRLKIYYKYAEKLIKLGHAYVCTCDPEAWRELIKKRLGCDCRALSNDEQFKRWKQMFAAFKEGSAVLRIKTDLEHPDPSIRDWPAFRIVDKPRHPLTKAVVWPLLNFASAIDDYEFKVTHILRGIDLSVSDVRQKYIYDYFGWKYPFTMYSGKLLISGIKSTSEIKKLIEEKKLTGWDDVSLGTIKALKRRGFQKEAIIELIKDIGIGRNDIKVSLDNLAAFNKDIVEKTSSRYFFVENPVTVKIRNAPGLTVKIPLHPDYKKRGNRVFKTLDEFYISDKLEPGRVYRLMHLFNFKDNEFLSKEHDPGLGAKIIHWLPAHAKHFHAEVLMPDNSIKKGIVEPAANKLKIDSVCQMERFAFLRLESRKKGRLFFVYAHR